MYIVLHPFPTVSPAEVYVLSTVMKNAVLACVVLAVGVAAQSENTIFSAKPATRMLRADVLRGESPLAVFLSLVPREF